MKYFSTLLHGDDNINTATKAVLPNPIYDDGVEIPSPSHEVVKIAIMRPKNNKAADPDGPPLNCLRPDAVNW